MMSRNQSSAMYLNEIGTDRFRNTKYEVKWKSLKEDIAQLEQLRHEYRESISQQKQYEARLTALLKACQSADQGLQKEIVADIRRQSRMPKKNHKTPSSPDDIQSLQEAMDNKAALEYLKEEKKFLEEVRKLLPQKSSRLLKLALGDVNVTFPSIADRVHYKQKYETFKVKMTMVALACAFLYMVLVQFGYHQKILEPIFQIFMVWYYSTLLLREHVLLANGSSIKSWWLTHHYISIAICIVMAIFPDSYEYRYYYNIQNWFSLYLGLVQLLQFRYQKARLYTLHTLGKADVMDVSTEGVQVKGTLAILIPALLIGQLWQLFNSYVLFSLFLKSKPLVHHYAIPAGSITTGESFFWHPLVLSLLFLVIAVGNMYTTFYTLYVKYIVRRRQRIMAGPGTGSGSIAVSRPMTRASSRCGSFGASVNNNNQPSCIINDADTPASSSKPFLIGNGDINKQ